jgi:carotenoid cleavage dioxygenase-like enzyme
MSSKSDAFHSAERLSEFVGEFPRCDVRYATEHYRHGWLLGFDPRRSRLAHIDHETGATRIWAADENTSLQEPCFIPRSKGAAEGEGYIVQLATRIREMRTDVLLFDALRVDEGPFATVHLPLRLRPGYHGNWADWDEIRPR